MKNTMKNTNELSGVLVGSIIVAVIAALIVMISIKASEKKESFIVLVDNHTPIKSDCPEYLYTDSKKYYAYDSRKMIDGVNNPIKFDTLEKAQDYMKSKKCGMDIPIRNVVVVKKGEDPTTFTEQTCAKKIAYADYKISQKMAKAKDLKEIRKYLNITNNPDNSADYDLEVCMSNVIAKQYPGSVENTNLENMYQTSDFSKFY